MAIETHHLNTHAVEYGSAEYWKQESQKNLADVQRLMARNADLEKLNHDLCDRVTENDEIRQHWEEIEQTRADNERMKARIKELERMDTEHTVQIAKMNGYIHHLEEELDASRNHRAERTRICNEQPADEKGVIKNENKH